MKWIILNNVDNAIDDWWLESRAIIKRTTKESNELFFALNDLKDEKDEYFFAEQKVVKTNNKRNKTNELETRHKNIENDPREVK